MRAVAIEQVEDAARAKCWRCALALPRGERSKLPWLTPTNANGGLCEEHVLQREEHRRRSALREAEMFKRYGEETGDSAGLRAHDAALRDEAERMAGRYAEILARPPIEDQVGLDNDRWRAWLRQQRGAA